MTEEKQPGKSPAKKQEQEKYPPSRDWEVTLFNADPEDESFLKAGELMQETFDAGVFQIEKAPETGRLHLQGFGQFATPRHFSTVQKALSGVEGLAAPHIEKCKSVRKLVEYCQKEETRVQTPVKWGEIRYHDRQGARLDLVELRMMVDSGMSVDDILMADEDGKAARYLSYIERLVRIKRRRDFDQQPSRPVKAYWLWGDSRVGKTSLIYDLYKPGEVYRVQSYKHPWDELDEQKHRVLVLDDFASDYMDFGVLLGVTDKWNAVLDARYAQKRTCWDTVWIISNQPPCDFYQYEERKRREGLFNRLTWAMKMTQDRRLVTFEGWEIADYMGDPANAPAGRFHSRQIHPVDSDWTRHLAEPPAIVSKKIGKITAEELLA